MTAFALPLLADCALVAQNAVMAAALLICGVALIVSRRPQYDPKRPALFP
jgi:hypothetical protein